MQAWQTRNGDSLVVFYLRTGIRQPAASDNLLNWLLPHRKRGGRITPEKNIDIFSERLRDLAQMAGINLTSSRL
jgi:hypothetical protein